MSDYKPLMYSIILIFVIGGLLIFLLEPFIDIEDLTEDDTWIDTFFIDDIIGFIFDIFNYILTGITWIFEAVRFSLFDLITSPEPEIQSYEITGTGTHEGVTLDGTYIWGSGKTYYLVNSSYDIWLRIDDPDLVTEVKLQTNLFVSTILRWFNVYETIYISETTWDNLVLQKTEYDFNTPADVNEGDYTGEERRPPFEAVSRVREFIDEAKETVLIRVNILGIIPQEVGVPLMIVFIIGSLITIIKLLPWT